MLRALVAVLSLASLAACGRLGFGATSDGGASGGDGAPGDGTITTGDGVVVDAPPSTGPLGPRYFVAIDNGSADVKIAGALGKVAVVEDFQGSTTLAGTAEIGHAAFESAGLVWLGTTGMPVASSVLDSTNECAVRNVGGGATNGGVWTSGYSEGTSTPADGACAISAGRQDGVTVGIDPTGAQTIAAHLVASGSNVQAWYTEGFTDGTVAISGVYGGQPTLGTTVLPLAGTDENCFYARVDPMTGRALWTATVLSPDEIEAGPIATASDGDVCLTGSFDGTTTVLGTVLTSAGLDDDWIARVDSSGNARFVRAIGTAGEEQGGGTSVAPTADGGCVIATYVPQDLTIDGLTLPIANGGGVLLRFDATGTASAGARVPGGTQIAQVGEHLYGASQCGAMCPISDVSYSPAGVDIALYSLDAALAVTIVGKIAGGAATFYHLAAIPPDALAVSFAVAPSPLTTFGSEALFTTDATNAVAVLGLSP